MDRFCPALLLFLLKTVLSSVSLSDAVAGPTDQGLNFGCGAAPVIPQTSLQILTAFPGDEKNSYQHHDNEYEQTGRNISNGVTNTHNNLHGSLVPTDGELVYFTEQPTKLPNLENEAFRHSTEDSSFESRGYSVFKQVDEDGEEKEEIYDYSDYSPEPRVLPIEESPSEDLKLRETTVGFKTQKRLPDKDVSNIRKIRKVFQDGDFLHKPGSIALYVCDEALQKPKELHKVGHDGEKKGFKFHSKKYKFTFKLVCKNGQWQGKHFQCGGCGQLPHIKNGYHVQLGPGRTKTRQFGRGEKLHEKGSRVQVLCHTGYELHGSDMLSCSSSGHWLPSRLPHCLPSPYMMEASTCSPPAVVAHASTTVVRGLVSSEGALHGTLVRHSCHRGYRAAHPLACNTSYTSRCEQGRWLGTIPVCERVSECMSPPVVHGSVLYDELGQYPLRSRLYYHCAPGHRLQGPPLLVCDASTGCWSPFGATPRCVPAHSDVPLMAAGSRLSDEGENLSPLGVLDMHTALMAAIGCLLVLLLAVVAVLLYRRTLHPKRMRRLHNSASHTGGDLAAAAAAGDAAGGAAPPQAAAQHQPSGPPGAPLLPYNCHGGLPQGLSNPRFAAKPFGDPVPQGVPPSYEECTRQAQPRPALMDHLPSCARPRGCSGRAAGAHRVAVAGGRRSRHRDNPDNISYQSIGSARHSAASMRSWSACDSLGSTDTMHAAVLGPGAEGAPYVNYNSSSGCGGGGSIASESTNVTLDTMSTLSSAAVSQAASCRALFGSRTSFDSSSLVTNEGAPLLEEAEEGAAAGEDCPALDQVSQSTREAEEPGVRDLRSPAFSLHE